MMLLIVAVLVLVSGGIVFAINYLNWRSISATAQEALETLSSNSGRRPDLRGGAGEVLPGKPDGTDAFADPETEPDRADVLSDHETESVSERIPVGEDERGAGIPDGPGGHGDDPVPTASPGQPPELEDALASLSNYYVVNLTSSDEITGWTSDRSDLYTDDLVEDMTALALSSGKKSGRIGSQFYRLTTLNGKKQLIVLDERLDILNARSVLRTTILIASIACLLLCIAAYFLIGVMVKPVQNAFEKQKQFVSDASHELKTPLAVIGANAQALEGEIGENEQLRYIRSEVKRSNQLVTELLTLARMDQGRTKAELKNMDLSQALLEVALPFESTAFEQGKQYEIDIPDGISCTGDEAMLKQLAVILLGNAFQYADEHGKISISARANGSLKEIRVSNTGPGIKPEDRERIFDRFYRGDAAHSREKEGFGLGLSIAANIVSAHRGKIRVVDGEKDETVFLVQLNR